MACKGKLPSGLEYEEMTGEEADNLKKLWFMHTDGIIQVQPNNRIIPKNFLKFADKFFNYNWQPSDILIITFPKSGTTWTQEIIWNLINNPDLDNPAANMSLDARFPNFEADMYLATTGAPEPEADGDPMKLFRQICPDQDYKDGLLIQLSYRLPPPRLLKAHLPLDFFPSDIGQKCKLLYVLRDPRDVLCSLYHYCRLQIVYGFRGTLDEFIDQVLDDKIIYGPYWEHLRLAWQRRNDPNFCIVHYEDLKADAFKEIKRIDKFLGTKRTDQQIKNVEKFTSFDQMKERSKANPPTSNDGKYFNQKVIEKEGGFFRKGIVGDWKNRFTEDQAKKINAWMAKNLESFGDDFKYKV